MKIKVKILLLIIYTVFFFIINPSFTYAYGIGVYGMYGYEENKYNNDSIINATNNKLTGSGLLFDTNLTKDDLLNYRASIGFEKIETHFNSYNKIGRDYDIGTPSNWHYYKIKQKDSYYRYGLLNTFGFRLFRNDIFRLWLGPELGIYYMRVTFSSIVAENLFAYILYSSINLVEIYPESHWFDMIQWQLGISFGVNINISDAVALSLQSGLHTGAIECIDTTVPEIDRTLSMTSTNNAEEPGDGTGYGGYVMMAVILKFNE